MPWFMVTVAALPAFQVRTAVCPLVIDVGEALRVTVGGTGPSGAIGQRRPSIPVLVVGVQVAGGLGTTDVFVW